jgi:hypothetical protein
MSLPADEFDTAIEAQIGRLFPEKLQDLSFNRLQY